MNSEENEIRKRAYTFDLEGVCKTLRICSSSSISKEKVMSFLESNGTTSFMTLATIYALYSTDVMYLCFDKNADIVFEVISTLAFTLFFVEIIVQSWCRENYLRIPTKQGILEAWHNASLTSRYRDKVKIIFAACQFGSFYFWLDMMSTVSMIFEVGKRYSCRRRRDDFSSKQYFMKKISHSFYFYLQRFHGYCRHF